MMRSEMRTAVLTKLVEARNMMDDPERPIYRRQAELMTAAGIVNAHTFNEIVTTLALEVPARVPGFALMVNDFEGYRLADRATVRDLKRQRTKLRTARTIINRVSTVLGAANNVPMVKMIGESLGPIVSMLEIALRNLDREVGAG